MTANNMKISDFQKMMAKCHTKLRTEFSKKELKHGKVISRKEAVDELNDLLIEAEYDITWRLLQQYLETLSIEQLIAVIGTVEKTLLPIAEDDTVFPPRATE